MKTKTILASREARLWVTNIIVPSVMLGASILAVPGVKEAVGEKIADLKEKIKFRRKA
jgi:hypothetical protein